VILVALGASAVFALLARESKERAGVWLVLSAIAAGLALAWI